MPEPSARLRRAAEQDVAFLSKLASDAEVEPFLMPGSGDERRLTALLALGRADDGPEGLFVIESADGTRAGGLLLKLFNARSRICELSGLMVAPAARRRGIGSCAVRLACHRALVDHRLHRIQAEAYGDNLVAHRLFEHVGFTREGVRRRAYWRREQWLDGVMFGLLAEELKADRWQ